MVWLVVAVVVSASEAVLRLVLPVVVAVWCAIICNSCLQHCCTNCSSNVVMLVGLFAADTDDEDDASDNQIQQGRRCGMDVAVGVVGGGGGCIPRIRADSNKV